MPYPFNFGERLWHWVFLLAFIGVVAVGCKPGAVITCPPMKQYSKQFQEQAAREYELVLKIAPHLTQMIDDYGVERDAIRACLKRKRSK